MAHAYSGDQLVERPAIQIFADLGWRTVSALEEIFGVGGTLGRDTKGEAVLVPRLRAALEWLFPTFPSKTISAPMNEHSRELLPTLSFEQDLLAD